MAASWATARDTALAATVVDGHLDILGCLSPEALQEHAALIVGCLEAANLQAVQDKAFDILRRLGPEALDIVKCLRSKRAHTRLLALDALHCLGQKVLQHHASAIVELLQDDSENVRGRAFEVVETLRSISSEALQEHVAPWEVEVVSVVGERLMVRTYPSCRVSDLVREVERAASQENSRAATLSVGTKVLDRYATVATCMTATDQITVVWRPRCKWETALLNSCRCSESDATLAVSRHGLGKRPGGAEVVDLDAKDVELVSCQIQCSPVDAAAALLRENNDIVEAVMYLSTQ